jgi:2-desacetyl-2-hydroxyethyl bacteriochlorophyllide A dehydrogenase
MANMRAALLMKPNLFELREVARPEIADDEVLVRVHRTGICGTDLHMFHGHYAADRLPLIPGHEFVGTVAKNGSRVSNVKEGDRVVVDINVGCGTCFWCRRNEVLNCPEISQIGIHRNGAFAEFVAVPARLVIAAPQSLSDAELALTEPIACVVRAARKANVRFGQSVVILGAGPIGNLHVQMMRLCGAAPIIVSDISAERCKLALDAGADVVVSDPATLRELVLDHTQGRGADVVIESVGNAKLYQAAFELIRKGGHVAFFGITGPTDTVSINILDTILKENSMKGSVAGMGEDMHDALALLQHGRFRTALFTAAVYPVEKIQNAFETIATRPADLKTQIIFA